MTVYSLSVRERKIDFLNRLLDVTEWALPEFLMSEKIIDLPTLHELAAASDKGKLLLQLIESAVVADKIQLAEYNWEFLPQERLRLKLVTSMNTKEFSLNY
jgi:hypothetical protein